MKEENWKILLTNAVIDYMSCVGFDVEENQNEIESIQEKVVEKFQNKLKENNLKIIKSI